MSIIARRALGRLRRVLLAEIDGAIDAICDDAPVTLRSVPSGPVSSVPVSVSVEDTDGMVWSQDYDGSVWYECEMGGEG